MSGGDWGSDAIPSLPQAIPSDGAEKVSMGGFAFTPYGLRPDLSVSDREELLAERYQPDAFSVLPDPEVSL